MVILSARGLHYTYPGGVQGLVGLGLDVIEGKRLAILGPNGAGKTTLLMHLNGTLRPRSGECHLEGQRAKYDRGFLNHWRTKVGLVLQDPDDQLFAGSVYQDVSFGPMNLDMSESEVRDRVSYALDAMRIGHLAERPIHMLSHGQKKRVAIAGVLAMQPKVLVLDEPTAGLDSHGVAHLVGALGHLVDSGTTIVYATHDAELAWAWSDRIAVFHEGTVINEGPTEDVLADGDLLQRAHIRPPLAIDIWVAMKALGLVEADRPLPQSRDEILNILGQLACISSSNAKSKCSKRELCHVERGPP
jgi:cobalt/nickel transport system ATP-binding protein